MSCSVRDSLVLCVAARSKRVEIRASRSELFNRTTANPAIRCLVLNDRLRDDLVHNVACVWARGPELVVFNYSAFRNARSQPNVVAAFNRSVKDCMEYLREVR
jgi:hypothetical protein